MNLKNNKLNVIFFFYYMSLEDLYWIRGHSRGLKLLPLNKRPGISEMSYYNTRTGYGRRRYGTRRRFRRRGKYRVKPNIKKTMRTMAAIRSVELKTFDPATISQTVGSTAGYIQCISNIEQGDDDYMREGREVIGKRLYCNYEFGAHTSSSGISVIRMIVLFDKEQQGTIPTIYDAALPAGVMKEMSHSSLFDKRSRKRFKIIYDNSWTMGTLTGEDDTPTKHIGKIYFNLPKRGLKMSYVNTNGLEASIGKNNLYCILLCNQAVETGVNASIRFRLRFYG